MLAIVVRSLACVTGCLVSRLLNISDILENRLIHLRRVDLEVASISAIGHTSAVFHTDYTYLEMEVRRKALDRFHRLGNSTQSAVHVSIQSIPL